MTDVVLRPSTGLIAPSARATWRLGFVGVGWIGRNRLASLAEPPDAWFGRAAVEWVRKLHKSPRFDPEAEEYIAVAATLDGIYGRQTDAPR